MVCLSPSRCTLAKATDQHHERVSPLRGSLLAASAASFGPSALKPLRGSLLAASAARFGPSALKVRSFWMD